MCIRDRIWFNEESKHYFYFNDIKPNFQIILDTVKIKIIGHRDRLFLRVTSSIDTQIMYKLISDPKLIQYTRGQQLEFIAEASVLIDNYDHYQNMIEIDML